MRAPAWLSVPSGRAYHLAWQCLWHTEALVAQQAAGASNLGAAPASLQASIRQQPWEVGGPSVGGMASAGCLTRWHLEAPHTGAALGHWREVRQVAFCMARRGLNMKGCPGAQWQG